MIYFLVASAKSSHKLFMIYRDFTHLETDKVMFSYFAIIFLQPVLSKTREEVTVKNAGNVLISKPDPTCVCELCRIW